MQLAFLREVHGPCFVPVQESASQIDSMKTPPIPDVSMSLPQIAFARPTIGVDVNRINTNVPDSREHLFEIFDPRYGN